jgi:hypothetical protein
VQLNFIGFAHTHHHAMQTLEACRHLQHFSEWLCQRPEYSIVLDGANVAYNGHQVRGQYVFKYHQVRRA